MNSAEKEKVNTMPKAEENASGSIYIEEGREILAERLELCLLRSSSFDPEKADPCWAAFLGNCLEILRDKGRHVIEKENLCKLKSLVEKLELCKLKSEFEAEELCKLQCFWTKELSVLPEELEALVPAWETTLQILLEAECSRAENLSLPEKEVRDILYSYYYDCAEEILKEPESGRFLPAFVSGKKDPQVKTGLSLFFGDRLKARLLDILEKNPELSKKLPAEGVGFPDLTSHQEKALSEFWKKAAALSLLVLLAFALAACGKTKGTEENASEAVTEDADAYPGTVAYEDSEQNISDRFGIMHATVLDVQNGDKDGLFIYTLRDREDPDNAWCLNSQDVGSIVCDVTGGREVAVLFSGDMVGDPDSVEFIAILEDAPYKIQKAEGTTVSNMMNSFTVRTTKGVELTFIKDNCKVDKDALSTENGARLLIYYTDGGTADHYPLRVYKLPQQER